MNYYLLNLLCSLNLLLFIANMKFWSKNPVVYIFILIYMTLPFFYAHFDLAISGIILVGLVINLACLFYIYKKEGKLFSLKIKGDNNANKKPVAKYILIIAIGLLIGISTFLRQYYKERNEILASLIKDERMRSASKISTDKAEYIITKGTPFINSYNIEVIKKAK